jgi:hypothetical protein
MNDKFTHQMVMAESFGKAEIINHLAAVHSFRRYLEVCCSSTGWKFSRIDRTRLEAYRLMYRCADHVSDGFAVDFRSGDADISCCLREINGRGLVYDVVLVDPFHEYETSLRDIAAAFELIEPGGYLVVHDCLPPEQSLAGPRYQEGEWCGVTYKAYLDFVTGRDDLVYYTVDTDYGCGVIRKLGALERFRVRLRRLLGPPPAGAGADLVRRWRGLGQDFEAAFCFFQKHQSALLRLLSVEEFLAIETVRPH